MHKSVKFELVFSFKSKWILKTFSKYVLLMKIIDVWNFPEGAIEFLLRTLK